MPEYENLIYGAIGGAIAGILTSEARKVPKVTITSNKETIDKKTVNANTTDTLLDEKSYKFAIILFHGDGDEGLTISIEGNTTRSLDASQQAIEIIANETISIKAVNNTSNNLSSPTIEILYLNWS